VKAAIDHAAEAIMADIYLGYNGQGAHNEMYLPVGFYDGFLLHHGLFCPGWIWWRQTRRCAA
jgi:hypothetical protein